MFCKLLFCLCTRAILFAFTVVAVALALLEWCEEDVVEELEAFFVTTKDLVLVVEDDVAI